jgi:transposase
MDQELGSMCASNGRLSIGPERLIRALLSQIVSSIRSERMLVEQLADEPVGDSSTFSKNRERFSTATLGHRLLTEMVRIADGEP